MFLSTNLKASLGRLDVAYGDAWKDWLPETLQAAIKYRWKGIRSIDLDRVLAARNLLHYGYFWDDVDIFEATINAFNWVDVDHRLGLHPSPGQIVYGVKIARDLIDKRRRFGEDVRKYIASVFITRELVYIPDDFNLGGVQEYLDHYYRDNDFRDAVIAKWKLVSEDENYQLDEKPVDIQVARLLAIQNFVDMGGTGRPMDKGKTLAKLILG